MVSQVCQPTNQLENSNDVTQQPADQAGNGRIRLINTDFDIIFELFYGIHLFLFSSHARL